MAAEVGVPAFLGEWSRVLTTREDKQGQRSGDKQQTLCDGERWLDEMSKNGNFHRSQNKGNVAIAKKNVAGLGSP